MICRKYQCLFVHIPKAAGQSIEQYFLDLLGLDWSTRGELLMRQNHDPDKGPPRLAHLTAWEYLSLGYLSPRQFETWYKFGFVRNPWSRLVSEFNFQRYCDHVDFKTFVTQYFPLPIHDDYETGRDLYRHVLPQHLFVCDRQGRQIVDFIGRIESLQADFTVVCERLGLPIKPLPVVNVGPHKHYTEYYDDETRAFVAKTYARDISLFGYTFGD